MSPEGAIYCSHCSFRIEKANLPDFPFGKTSLCYPKDKEMEQQLAEQLIEHHVQTGETEIGEHGHRHYNVIIGGEENTHIITESYFVEYYISGPTIP